MADNEHGATPPPRPPTFWEAFRIWVKIGLLSFGGPTGQIALMHTELLERRRWVGESRFLHALNYCMLLPGPEAHQLAIYIGWLLHRGAGGLVAGIWFVLPGAAVMLAVSFGYVWFGRLPAVEAVFYGLKAAVLGIVAAAVLRLGRKALKTKPQWIVSGSAFVALFFLDLPFPAIIVSAGLAGLLAGRWFPSAFQGAALHGTSTGGEGSLSPAAEIRPMPRPSARKTALIAAVGLLAWVAPIGLVWAFAPGVPVLLQESLFFAKAALVTFGGAYAVLPYVAQQAVETYGWLSPAQMIDGLGLAETTPGPLILVLQFTGFLGGWNHPGTLSPALAGAIAAALTSWMTFVPSFLFIFLGAPYIERLHGNQKLSSMLGSITAAVVGVVLNLAVWFGGGLLFPRGGGPDYFVLAVSLLAFLGLTRWRWDIIPVVLGSGLAGWVYRAWIGGGL